MSLATAGPSSLDSLRESAHDLAERLVQNRRRIHAFPELGLTLPKTQALVLEELKRIGVDSIREGSGLSSVVAEIHGTGPGADSSAAATLAADSPGTGAASRGSGSRGTRPRVVALRADMDALPLTENNGLDFASRNAGCMHACGHDSHVSMLIGAAEILAARRASFAGTVRLLFQPGEEGFGGARIMIEEGDLDGVDEVFGLHVDPSMPTGSVFLRKKTIMASADAFVVVFKGAGGHASMPYHARDPIPAIGPFVDGLSHVAARETNPDDRIVLSVTQVSAGTTNNVIPPTATCGGTIRALSAKRRALAHQQLERVARGVAAARGVDVDVNLLHGYPPTVNHDEPVELVARVAADLGLRVIEMPSPVMGAEDFSYMLEKVPGAFVFLGAQTEGGGPLHSDLMKLDESVMRHGAALHAALALAGLSR